MILSRHTPFNWTRQHQIPTLFYHTAIETQNMTFILISIYLSMAKKVMEIKPQMRDNIVRLLRTSPGRVNVKARTHEKVDAVGEGRAMACHVVVLLEKNPSPWWREGWIGCLFSRPTNGAQIMTTFCFLKIQEEDMGRDREINAVLQNFVLLRS